MLRHAVSGRLPGSRAGAQAWEACMLPLHYRRPCAWHPDASTQRQELGGGVYPAAYSPVAGTGPPQFDLHVAVQLGVSQPTGLSHDRHTAQLYNVPRTQALLRHGASVPQPGRGYCTATQENAATQRGALGSVVFFSS